MNLQRLKLKAEKKKAKRKKIEKMRNILKAWQHEELNRRRQGLEPRRMPLTFKERQ
jgi:hypothetical protein